MKKKKNTISLNKKDLIKTLLIMKLAVMLFFGLSLQIFGSAYSQSAKLTINLKNVSIVDVFEVIENQSDFKFLYHDDLISSKKNVTINSKNKTIEEVLNDLFAETGNNYTVLENNLIVITPKLNQQITVNGTVVSATTNEPLVGVNVVEKGTINGTTTDSDGNYTLSVSNEQAILVFSYIGYIEEEVTVGDRTSININLTENVTELDEVIVIGYGIQKKKLNTGATVHVKGEDFLTNHATRLETSLQGQTPGMLIVKRSGQPGENFNITIRGIGSVNGTDPLVLIDGVPGELKDLNPNDVESIDVLKDAASAAIYGSRAGNGVVLVTTKQGKAGKVKVTYDAYYGVANQYRKVPMLNAKEYALYQNEAAINSGQLPFFTLEDINNLEYDTDWQDVLFRKNAPTMSHHLGVSGGTEKSVYSASLSYLKEEGIIGPKGKSEYERYSFRVNTQQKLSKIFTTGENFAYTRISRSGVGIGNIYDNTVRNFLQVNPLFPVYDTAYDDGYGRSTFTPDHTNPLGNLKYNHLNERQNDLLIGNIYAEAEIIRGLKFKTDFGMNLDIETYREFNPVYQLTATDFNSTSKVKQESYRRFSYNYDNTLSYQKYFGEHNILALIGMNVQDNRLFSIVTEQSDVTFNDFGHALLSNATNTSDGLKLNGDGGKGDSRYSYFGRLSYNYSEKYMATVSLRRDASSKFGPNYRFGYFPAFSAGWVISNEKFLESASWLDFLKIRGSWGQNGLEPFDAYQFMATVVLNDRYYYFGAGETKMTGYSPDILPNPDLKWEASTQTNIGFDSRFLNSFSLSFDWYNRTSKDWIVNVPVPAILGLSLESKLPYINGGNVTNKGVEVQLGYIKNFDNLSVNVSGNLAYNENVVSDIPNSEGVIHGSSNFLFNGSAEVSRVEEGYPVGYFWGFETDGIFQSEEEIAAYVNNGRIVQPNALPGDVKFVDRDLNGVINDDDKTMIGDPNPDIIYGVNLALAFKGVDFLMNIQGQQGNQVVQSQREIARYFNNYTTEYLERWTGPGTSDRIPRATMGNDANQNWNRFSDLYVHDAGFLRIKSVNIGYDFKQSLMKDLPIEQFRLYVSATNLITFTKYNGMDPEVGFAQTYDASGSLNDQFASGIDIGFYPSPRTYLIGVNVKF